MSKAPANIFKIKLLNEAILQNDNSIQNYLSGKNAVHTSVDDKYSRLVSVKLLKQFLSESTMYNLHSFRLSDVPYAGVTAALVNNVFILHR